jgi:hypothetical protein
MATFMDRSECVANGLDVTFYVRRHCRKLVVNPHLIENVERGRNVLTDTSSGVRADRNTCRCHFLDRSFAPEDIGTHQGR